jgi:hypothetical protein
VLLKLTSDQATGVTVTPKEILPYKEDLIVCVDVWEMSLLEKFCGYKCL